MDNLILQFKEQCVLEKEFSVIEQFQNLNIKSNWECLLDSIQNISNKTIVDLQSTNVYYLEKISFENYDILLQPKIDKIHNLLVLSINTNKVLFVRQYSYQAYQYMYEIVMSMSHQDR